MTEDMKSIDKAMYEFRERERIAKNFLKAGFDPEAVAKNTEIPLYWVLDLKKSMELEKA